VIGLGLAESLLPSLSKTGGLFAHEAYGTFDDVQVTKFCFSGFLLQVSYVNPEDFVLLPKSIDFLLKISGALGLDFEVGVEMALEFFALVLYALNFFFEVSPGCEAGLPDEKGDKESEEEAPDEGSFEKV